MFDSIENNGISIPVFVVSGTLCCHRPLKSPNKAEIGLNGWMVRSKLVRTMDFYQMSKNASTGRNISLVISVLTFLCRSDEKLLVL